jgi:hypothetical protein
LKGFGLAYIQIMSTNKLQRESAIVMNDSKVRSTERLRAATQASAAAHTEQAGLESGTLTVNSDTEVTVS